MHRAFYLLPPGGWRDYLNLLHAPYTAWHLSYVLLGAALSPAPDPRIVAGALVAFGLAVGVGAHAFDELNGRPLRTGIPSPVLVALGTAALLVAVALGLVAATMRELARVVKPGGRLAMVEFGLPSGIWRPLWWLYTRVGLPLGGRVFSRTWSAVGAFLGPSIEQFYARYPAEAVERYWLEAGLGDVRTRRMSLGGGVVMSATKK